MLIPIADDNRDRSTTPYVNYVLIGLNLFVFVFFQRCGDDVEFTYAFSTVPAEIMTGEDVVTEDRIVKDRQTGQRFRIPGLQATPVPVQFTMVTSMFMHGGIMHLLGNMLYLWIFGDNIEDRLGRRRYIMFYLTCGILASLAHVGLSVFGQSNMLIPSLGASGAISGVLGAYLLLYPRKRVTVILFHFLTRVPAIVAIGVWFLFQLFGGVSSLGSEGGGVAFGAHIGGFLAGLVLVKVFAIGAR